MNPLAPYLPIDRLRALSARAELPSSSGGAVLFADVAGFTGLTSSLARDLGARRGAEELTRILNAVYEVLIDQVHAGGGSVVTFSGDAMTCVFGDDAAAGAASVRAAAAAERMHRALAGVETPGASAARLSVRIAIERGTVHRRLAGNPDIQLLEVVAGAVMDRLAVAARLSRNGDIVAGPSAMRELTELLASAEAIHEDADGQYARVARLRDGDACAAEDDTCLPDLPPERLRPWLLPSVFQRLTLGQTDFLAELRPAAVMLLRAGGFHFDSEAHAGDKLDALVRWVQGVAAQAEGVLLDVSAGQSSACLYVAFGAPIAHDDDAVRAVETARRLTDPRAALAFITEVRIGLGHGRMRAGPVRQPGAADLRGARRPDEPCRAPHGGGAGGRHLRERRAGGRRGRSGTVRRLRSAGGQGSR